jgi:hypothetical protein
MNSDAAFQSLIILFYSGCVGFVISAIIWVLGGAIWIDEAPRRKLAKIGRYGTIASVLSLFLFVVSCVAWPGKP